MYDYLDMEENPRSNPAHDLLLWGETLWNGLDQWLPEVEEL
jgi:hypothetical protein